MFHLKYPRTRGFFTWDELGCLARALGFAVDLFKLNLHEEMATEDDQDGISLDNLIQMINLKMLYKALHLTVNLHTADWNMCVTKRCLAILDHRALKFEDINNARVAYQAYEAGDMKGMVLKQHVLMRTLKMCGKTISPMKLMHRIKHSKDMYDEPGRIQLYEFIDLILWADIYETYTPDSTFGHFEMQNKLFKLTDFDKLLTGHDERLANRLNAQYLKDEWEFPNVKVGSKSRYKAKFADTTVVCGDARVDMTSHQKNSYRHLRAEVMRSQKEVHCMKGGSMRERPITAPNLAMYSQRHVAEFKRKQSLAAQNVIYNKLQQLLQHVYNQDFEGGIEPVDLSDRPVMVEPQRCETPKVVTTDDVKETANYKERLLFDIETQAGRYEIARDFEMESYIPQYKHKKEMENIQKASEMERQPKKTPRSSRKQSSSEDVATSLAYPTPRLPPSHAKKCDARFRGWYTVRSKKGPHYILMTPYFHDSPKGQLFRKLATMSDQEIKRIHGEFILRKTKTEEVDKRPVTAPAVMTMDEYKSHMFLKSEPSSRNTSKLSRPSRASSGYSSMAQTITPTDKDPLPLGSTNAPRVSSEFKDFSFKEYKGLPVRPLEQVTEEAEEETPRQEEILDLNESTEKFPPKSTMSPCDEESGLGDVFECDESANTSFSEKVKLLAVEEEEKRCSSGDSGRRVKSAYVQRSDQLQNSQDTLLRDAEEGRQQRSVSALGDNRRDRAPEDQPPMPYMDHSKAKVVSVGSIGKISLLESIYEAKFWEDMAIENGQVQLGARKQAGSGGKARQEQPWHNLREEEEEAIEQPREQPRDHHESEEAVRDEKENLEQGCNSRETIKQDRKHVVKKEKQPIVPPLQINGGDETPEAEVIPVKDKRKTEKTRKDNKQDEELVVTSSPKKRSKNEFIASDNDKANADILAMILQEEKRRRKHQKSNGRSNYDYCSSAKSGSTSTSASTHSNRARLGSGNSASSSIGVFKDRAANNDDKCNRTSQDNNRSQSYPLQYRSALKSPQKANRGGTEKHVILRTVSELQREHNMPQGKYERLVTRLGDDMTPYMKKQMLKMS